MYKKILCAVDTSPESKAILSKAASIAENYGSVLSVAHIMEYTFLPKDYQKNLKEEVEPKINTLADKYNIAKKHRYIRFGQPYSKICEIERKIDADLIVVGTHGKHGIKALLGATANGVVQQAKCDVLLVKVG